MQQDIAKSVPVSETGEPIDVESMLGERVHIVVANTRRKDGKVVLTIYGVSKNNSRAQELARRLGRVVKNLVCEPYVVPARMLKEE